MIDTYYKEINDWKIEFQYTYIEAEPETHDYPGCGSHIEIDAIFVSNEDENGNLVQTNIAYLLYEIAPDWVQKMEDEIIEHHEDV